MIDIAYVYVLMIAGCALSFGLGCFVGYIFGKKDRKQS